MPVKEKLSPTEQRLYDTLKDGRPHRREELHTCLFDEMSGRTALRYHISNLRKKLLNGYEIICVFYQRTWSYRMVRSLHSPNDGRT